MSSITFTKSPVFGLQQLVAADPRLDGVLFELARFNKDGCLELYALTNKKQDPALRQLLKENKELIESFVKNDKPEDVLKSLSYGDAPKDDFWQAMRKGLQAKLSAAKNDLVLRQTRLDRAYFLYDGTSLPSVFILSVCVLTRTKRRKNALIIWRRSSPNCSRMNTPLS